MCVSACALAAMSGVVVCCKLTMGAARWCVAVCVAMYGAPEIPIGLPRLGLGSAVGLYEALELRDGGSNYLGKGVSKVPFERILY